MACDPGFFGISCDLSCPPGTFGDNCGGECQPKCSNEECDKVYGCPQYMKSGLRTTISDFFQTYQQERNTTNDYHVSSESIFVVNDDSVTKNEFTTIYILVGLGPIVSLLLLVTIMQFCKRVKSSKCKNARTQACSENYKHRVFLNQTQHTSQQSNDKYAESPCPTVHFYKPAEMVYEEIIEGIEINPTDVFNPSDCYERPKTSSKNLPLSHENTVSSLLVDAALVKHNEEEIGAAGNTYLTPLSTQEVQGSNKA